MMNDAWQWIKENIGFILIIALVVAALAFDSMAAPMNFGCGFSIDSHPTEQGD